MGLVKLFPSPLAFQARVLARALTGSELGIKDRPRVGMVRLGRVAMLNSHFADASTC